MPYEFDVLYVREKGIASKISRKLKGRGFDAVLLSHPSAVGVLYTCINIGTQDAFVITSRAAAERYDVVLAKTEEFDEEVPKSVLNVTIKDKIGFIDAHRVIRS